MSIQYRVIIQPIAESDLETPIYTLPKNHPITHPNGYCKYNQK